MPSIFEHIFGGVRPPTSQVITIAVIFPYGLACVRICPEAHLGFWEKLATAKPTAPGSDRGMMHWGAVLLVKRGYICSVLTMVWHDWAAVDGSQVMNDQLMVHKSWMINHCCGVWRMMKNVSFFKPGGKRPVWPSQVFFQWWCLDSVSLLGPSAGWIRGRSSVKLGVWPLRIVNGCLRTDQP